MKNVNSFGFELELFLKRGDEYVVPSKGHYLPTDACGYLVEIRGDPHSDPLKAMYLMKADLERVTVQAANLGYNLELAHTAPISKNFLRLIRRSRGKNPSKSFFAYGGMYRSDTPRAGLHIHFGSLITKKYDNDNSFSYTSIVNIPRILQVFDTEFKKEISDTKRIRGEYEIKEHGFEYRSLPATTDLNKVVSVLEKLKEEYC